MHSDRETLERYMTDKRIGAYVGIDPTAASLHVGHLLPLMCLFWMYVNGYNTVSLLGGATATIGDPTDRLTSRTLDPDSIRTANVTKMHSQLKKLWRNAPAYGEKYGYKWEPAWQCELVNNNAWWEKLPMLKVLQLLGPGMRMGSMLARETWVFKRVHTRSIANDFKGQEQNEQRGWNVLCRVHVSAHAGVGLVAYVSHTRRTNANWWI